MSNRFAVSVITFATVLGSQAIAQIPGDAYLATPGIGGAGGFAFSALGVVDSTIDGASEVIGTTIVTPDSVNSSDTIVNNGGGNFVLTLRVSSVGDVAPTGFTVGGQPATTAGFFMGANAGGDRVNFTNAAVVNTATIAILDQAGAVIGGPFNIAGFANFADPAFGGGWNGSLGVTFGAGSVGGIGGYELVVDYNEGVLIGTFAKSGLGCPPGLPVKLSASTNPRIGVPVTITASDLPAGVGATSLLFGLPPAVPVPMDLLGATGCTLYVANIFTNAAMAPVTATSAALTLSVANDPGAVGLQVDVQAASIAIGANPFGVVTSDLGTITIGG